MIGIVYRLILSQIIHQMPNTLRIGIAGIDDIQNLCEYIELISKIIRFG